MRPSRRLESLLCLFLLVSGFSRLRRVEGKKPQRDNNNNNGDDDDRASAGGIVWQDLSLTTTDGKTIILHPFSGRVAAGQVCGILGPSGAGKSSFLTALAGLTTLLDVDGQVYTYHRTTTQNWTIDHNDKDETYQRLPSRQVAWLQQHDDFFSMLTVQETLELAAFLELPHLTRAQRHELVQTQLHRLGLTNVAYRRVGEATSSTMQARISGGERRRLAVALELLTDKQILLADEATSGLDASMSNRVVQLIRQVAQDGHIPAICSLHQPRSSIWKMLDYVIVMASGGHVCYSGPRAECLPYFEQLGYPCPSETNPAEFLMDLISVDTSTDQERLDFIISNFAQREETHNEIDPNAAVWRDATTSGAAASKSNFGLLTIVRRFGALLRRSWRQNIRNYNIHAFRLVASAVNAALLAAIFPSVAPGKPPSPSSVADRVALLSFGAINMCFLAFMKTITLIADERPVVNREQTRSQYSALEYLAAKVLAELPMDSMFASIFTSVLKKVSGLRIGWKQVTATFSLLTTAGASLGLALGCWSTNADLGKTASIPVLVLLMVVGVINPSGVDPSKSPPKIVRWIKKVSPFAYAIEALCLKEYPGMSFRQSKTLFSRFRDLPRMGGLAMVENGDQVIEALGLGEQTYFNAMKHLGALSAGYLVLSWIGLAVQYWIPKIQQSIVTDKKLRRRQNPEPSDRRESAQPVSKQSFTTPIRLKM